MIHPRPRKESTSFSYALVSIRFPGMTRFSNRSRVC